MSPERAREIWAALVDPTFLITDGERAILAATAEERRVTLALAAEVCRSESGRELTPEGYSQHIACETCAAAIERIALKGEAK